MTVKLNSLSRWSLLQQNHSINFESDTETERLVRLQLNLEAVTSFYIEDERGANFLCTMSQGVDTLEFYAGGSFRVFAEEGSAVVLYQSADLEPTFSEVIDPVIFTKIANRRHRNPELEEILYRSQMNLERRLEQQASEMDAAFARRIQEMENGRSKETVRSNAPGSDSSGYGTQQAAPGATGEKPGETPAGGAGSGQPGGETGGGDGQTGVTKSS